MVTLSKTELRFLMQAVASCRASEDDGHLGALQKSMMDKLGGALIDTAIQCALCGDRTTYILDLEDSVRRQCDDYGVEFDRERRLKAAQVVRAEIPANICMLDMYDNMIDDAVWEEMTEEEREI